ncbi:MAG: hypothetical protein A4E66_02178 [Syntrophus sp. PtaB.Bin001]|nr:MAG: hypothetical protein A4E66_02178 [Syntrophus sp. PtaB.Bin001]
MKSIHLLLSQPMPLILQFIGRNAGILQQVFDIDIGTLLLQILDKSNNDTTVVQICVHRPNLQSGIFVDLWLT